MDEAKIGYRALANGLTEVKGGYSGHIPEPWRQGRTVYGGLTAGLALAAAQKQFPYLPPFRSATINFIGPVTDNPVFTSRILRQGRNVTSVETEARVGNAIVGTCIFIFAGLRESNISANCRAPHAPPPKECGPLTPKAFRKYVAEFFHRFDTRLIAGKRPMSEASEGYIRTWSRHADPASRDGIGSLLTLGDVLPPAASPMFTKMGPISSINWMFTVLTDDPQTQDGWWHIETKLTAARGSYSSQVMRIWNTEGELVAEGMQCVAIFV